MAAVAKFGKSAATRMLTWMFPIRGRRGGRSAVTGGIEKGDTTSFLLLAHIMLVKKYCHHMILRWCPTNLGLLYTMVPSDWHGNAVYNSGFSSTFSVLVIGPLCWP